MPPPWVDCPTIEVDAALGMERSLRAVPDHVLVAGRTLVDKMRSDTQKVPTGLAEAIVARTLGRHLAEARAWAGPLNASWREILAANCAYDLILNYLACSTAVVAGPDGPIIARNMDWWPEEPLARASCTIRHHDSGEHRFSILGWPGSIGAVSGLSARGFAIALNAVFCDEKPPLTGYPVLLTIRETLEHARGYADAVDRLCSQTLAAPGMMAVAGTTNDQRIIIERTPTRCEVRRPSGSEPLVMSNHYVALQESSTAGSANPLSGSACGRFEALTNLLRGDLGTTDPALLYALCDPEVFMTITAQQMILRPAQGTSRLTAPRRLMGPA